MITMMRAILSALLIVAVPLAGCTDTDDGEPTMVTISWVDEPADATVGDRVSFTWSVDGPAGEIPHTGVHWGPDSVSDPSSPSEYPRSSGVTEPATIPGEFDSRETIDVAGTYYFRAHAIVDGEHYWSAEVDVTITGGSGTGTPILVSVTDPAPTEGSNDTFDVDWELTGVPGEIQHTGFHYADHPVEDPQSPADYGTHSGVTEPAMVPGNYSTTITFDVPGMYYGRAHAIADGEHYWSREVTFEVANGTGGNDTGPQEHTIEMRDLVTPSFSPDNITVRPGDTITWINVGSLTHTATFDNETLGDSGDVAAGGEHELTIPLDLEPGTYDYICIYHEGVGMTGTIVVEAAGSETA